MTIDTSFNSYDSAKTASACIVKLGFRVQSKLRDPSTGKVTCIYLCKDCSKIMTLIKMVVYVWAGIFSTHYDELWTENNNIWRNNYKIIYRLNINEKNAAPQVGKTIPEPKSSYKNMSRRLDNI